jgi:hypothetical protein
MRTSLIRRIGKLEGAIMQDNHGKPADLSMLSIEELRVLEKVLDYTLARKAAAPTGKRPLVADPSGLSADDMVVYQKMARRLSADDPHRSIMLASLSKPNAPIARCRSAAEMAAAPMALIRSNTVAIGGPGGVGRFCPTRGTG